MKADYVCIKKDSRHSFCDRYIWYEFTFVDLEHAKMSMKNKDRMIPCPDCLKEAKREIS